MTIEIKDLKPLPKAVAVILSDAVEDRPSHPTDERVADYLKWFNNVEAINATLRTVESKETKVTMTPNFYNGLRGTLSGLVKEGYDKGFLVPAYQVKMDGI